MGQKQDTYYDAVIIGFGKGGKTLAGALGAAGKKTALIERSAEMYGGTCINAGCIPTKSLVHSAAQSKAAARGGRENRGWEEKTAGYLQATEQKKKLVAMLREKNRQKLVSAPNVTLINGKASFISPEGIQVETEKGTQEIYAGQFFINTGSEAVIPPIKGIENNPYVYVSETLLALETLPKRLVIIGGGYIGVEFASIYADFGSEVAILQDGDVFLPRENREIAQAVLENMESRGITVRTGVKVKEIRQETGYASAKVQTAEGAVSYPAEAVLIATGRRPATKALHLDAAGVKKDERGGILTDQNRKTSVSHIYAMGDAVGGLQFTYISLDDSRIVKSAVLGDGSYTLEQRGSVPYSVFLNPPFSRVGLSEKEAVEAGYHIKTARLSAAAVPKAQVAEQPEGLLKVVVDADSGRILGAHLFCAQSHELINLIKFAMDAGLPYTALRDMIFTHPTMGEALNDLFQI